MFAEVVVVERQALRQGIAGSRLDADPVCGGQLLQPLCQHYAFTGHRVVRNHDFAHGDADAQLRPDFVAEASIVFAIGGLEFDRRGHRVRGPGKLGHQGITANFVRGTAVPGDGFGETPEHVLKARMRKCLILLHQQRRIDHVGVE